MSIIRSKIDLEILYKMRGERIEGIIYDPEESDDLEIITEKHQINISGEGVVSIEPRFSNVTEAIEYREKCAAVIARQNRDKREE